MNNYNFDKLEDRTNTMSAKWDQREAIFGTQNLIPMWVADSDWQTAPAVKNELISRAEEGIFGYSFATAEITNSIQEWLKKRFDLTVASDWLQYDTGVVPAINFTLKAITEAGDGVIIQPPVYRPFFESVKNNDCLLVENTLVEEDGYYQMDFAGLEEIIANWQEKPGSLKAFILCSPHNPVGRVWKRDELIRLIKILQREKIYLLTDEIHADLIYRGYQHYPILKLLAEEKNLKDYQNQVVAFMAASKTFNIAGLHTSYTIIADPKLRHKYQAAKAGFATGNSPFGLLALQAAYQNGEEWLEAQLDYLTANYQFCRDFIKQEIPGLKLSRAEGTYLAWLDFRQLSFESDQELSKFIAKEAGLGMNQGNWFGRAGSMFMRLNLACPRQRIKTALKQLKKALSELN
ncbi:MalY/PatB family protein [Halanaerobium salsuginis]|jgi:cystathionine beta-lyase|uniref:cysteine-S-conjugate beta-lyase n=1 Tax=Halanaerobium salsuginis TaxID=29563 RepID=A0A1I4F6K9_9FIRM|nr:MalY/PatB family protein [Halanaerobium salsuginis]SFL13622.1 cystathione beta-lyase [Halanaerobium salsuginis]